MLKIAQIIHNKDALIQSSITKNEYFLVEKRPMNDITYTQRRYYQTKCSSKVSKETFEQIRLDLQKLPFENFLAMQLSEGNKIPQYNNLRNIFSEQKFDLIHQNNQVLVLFFWSTWSEISKSNLHKFQQILLNNNTEWNQKIKFISFSVDESIQSAKNYLSSKNYDKIQHLSLLGWKQDNKIIQNFQVKQIPTLVIINKNGVINYMGRFIENSLQQKLNLMMKEQLINQITQQNTFKLVKNQQKQKQLLKQINQLEIFNTIFQKNNFEQLYENAELFSLNGKISVKIVNNNLQLVKINLKISTFSDTPQWIQFFKQKLKKFHFPQNTKLDLIQNLVEFQNIPYIQNPICFDCQEILKLPYYWCRWDLNSQTFRCRKCVQKQPQNQNSHFSYLNNSILLANNQWKRIPIKGLGKNIQPQSIQKVLKPHQFECNSCQTRTSKIGQAKYICLACQADPNPRGDFIDLCRACVTLYFQGDQQTKLKMNIDGHRKEHPLLRILYNVSGYYKF